MTENLEKRLKELEADCMAAFKNDPKDIKVGLTHVVLSCLTGSVIDFDEYPQFLNTMALDAHEVSQAAIAFQNILSILHKDK